MINIKNRTILLSSALSVIGLLVVNLAFFYKQYLGEDVFPWDFFSAVSHGQAIAWFRDGSIFHPPAWLPYGSMGFPAWWSLQSGGWYLPLQILSWTGIEYSFFVAAKFQALHAFIGAVATFFLARRLNGSVYAALVAALIYHFSSIFYSNAEHVEIVRGAALLPLLLLACHPRFILGSAVRFFFSCLVIWQFLIAAYPGIVVSGAYTLTFVIILWLCELEANTRLRYLSLIVLSGTSGLLLAMGKWLIPVLLAASSYTAKPIILSFHLDQLPTLLFHYGLPFMKQDVTMQSLWCPPIAFLFFIFLKKWDSKFRLPILLILLAFFCGFLPSFWPQLRELLPAFKVSRLAHSDWRPILHLGFAIFGCVAFDQLMKERMEISAIFRRLVLGIGLLILASAAAIHMGYKIADIRIDVGIILAALALTAFFLIWKKNANVDGTQSSLRYLSILAVAIVTTLLLSYLQYFFYVKGPWHTPWTTDSEKAVFGDSVDNLLKLPVRKEYTRRPGRHIYGDPLKDQIDLRYNKAWYVGDFDAFGYDNLGSLEYKNLWRHLQDVNTGQNLLEFLVHPGQIIIYSQGSEFDPRFASACSPESESCAKDSTRYVKILSYKANTERFFIHTDQPAVLTQNEIWYDGWKGELCSSQDHCQAISSIASNNGLRSWVVPAGDWTFTTKYKAPFFALSLVLMIIGLAIALAGTAFLLCAKKRAKCKPGNPHAKSVKSEMQLTRFI